MWRIKHKPTGLFYGPAFRIGGGRWSNLSEDGKVYRKRPSLAERPWFRDNTGAVVTTTQFNLEVIPA